MRALPRRRVDTGGFIVFGALVLISLALTTAVLLGKILNARQATPYVDPTPPQLQYLLDEAELLSGGRVTHRLQRGDSVWIRTLASGDVAVFLSAERREVAGFLGGHLLSSTRPTP